MYPGITCGACLILYVTGSIFNIFLKKCIILFETPCTPHFTAHIKTTPQFNVTQPFHLCTHNLLTLGNPGIKSHTCKVVYTKNISYWLYDVVIATISNIGVAKGSVRPFTFLLAPLCTFNVCNHGR